ncbi:hypothetical protein [Mycobacterium attenuatum]|uniref:hypothetical protein n=1 Tax=Mycobacterium attenuatum TaxID=2341086 RepID=UPI000F0175D4|nr:hypothetical protein LAUMK41_04666 [Mycobacterium attenuatum]
MDWRGAAADTLRTETHSDMLTTSAVADQLHEAAKVARSGAADLYAARSRVRYAVQDARAAGFDVGEDLSVTDRSSGGSAAQRAARLTQAQAFAGDIRQRAVQLSGSISKSSPKSPPSWPASATPSRQRLSPPHRHKASACRPSTTAPGNRTRRRRRRRNLPPVPSADDIRKVLHKLPVGNSPDVREIRSPEDLQNLWRCAQQNGVEILNG